MCEMVDNNMMAECHQSIPTPMSYMFHVQLNLELHVGYSWSRLKCSEFWGNLSSEAKNFVQSINGPTFSTGLAFLKSTVYCM